jgi:hypothetical protein
MNSKWTKPGNKTGKACRAGGVPALVKIESGAMRRVFYICSCIARSQIGQLPNTLI